MNEISGIRVGGNGTGRKAKTINQHKEATPFEKHVISLNARLQEGLGKHNFPISITMIPRSVQNHKISQFNDDKSSIAFAYLNQIDTLVDVLAQAYDNPNKAIVMIGSTQLGKTMLMILCTLLEAFLYAKTGVVYKTMIFTPGKTSLYAATRKDFEDFMALYDFRLEVPFSTEESHKLHADLGTSFTFSQYRNQSELMFGLENFAMNVPVFIKTKGESLDTIQNVRKEIHDKGGRIIAMQDEIHYGSAQDEKDTSKGSILAEIMAGMNNIFSTEEGDLLLAISATPFQIGRTSNISAVFCKIGSGYIGYPWWAGDLLDPSASFEIPEHISLKSDDVFSRFAVDEMKYIDKTRYRNKKQYESWKAAALKSLKSNKLTLKIQELQEVGIRWGEFSHEDYKTFCEEKLLEITKACLLDYNELDANGFIIRFFHTNKDATKFVEKYKEKFAKLNIHAVTWQGDEAKKSLRQHLESQGISVNHKKVIFVTGHGRMGNRIENDDKIYFGADFSQNSNLTCVLQGLLGRMTGYKSMAPIMFVESKVCKILDLFVKTHGAIFGTKPHERSECVNQRSQITNLPLYINCRNDQHSLEALGLNDHSQKITDFVRKVTKKYANDKNKETFRGLRLSEQEKHKFWKEILNDEFFDSLEEKLNYEIGTTFLRFATEEEIEEKFGENIVLAPYCDEQQSQYNGTIGFRSVGAVEGGSQRTDRTKNSKIKGHRNCEIQIHCEYDKKKHEWKPTMIKLRLCKTIEKHPETIVLPSKKDVSHNFMSEEDKRLIR